MRKMICLLAALPLLLTACAQPQQQELKPVDIEKKDYSAYQGIVMDTKTWYEEFKN